MIEPTDEMREAFDAAMPHDGRRVELGDDHLDACLKAVLALVERDQVRPIRSLLSELVDPDDCWHDHNGLCQAHSLDPAPCPHARAKTLLATPPQ